jgi:hypothetical protein
MVPNRLAADYPCEISRSLALRLVWFNGEPGSGGVLIREPRSPH